MQALRRDWGTMHVEVETRPDGVPAVFLHSLGTDLRMWDAVQGTIAGLGSTVRLDFRGHGLSAVSPGPFAIADLAGDVLAAMDHAGLDRAMLVGCSVGGLVSQRVALDAPDRVAALVLSNTAPRLGTPETWGERVARIEATGLSAMAEEILSRWFGPEMRARPEADLWRAVLDRMPDTGYTALCRAIAGEDLTGRVDRIAAPCLVIAGSEDAATPTAQVRTLAEAIPGARFVEIGGASHIPAVETPGPFAAAVAAFIDEVIHD